VLISDRYRELNMRLHKNPAFGSRVRHQVYVEVGELAMRVGATGILDYGCGKGEMARHLKKVTSYDPAVLEFMCLPEPHDVVACCDVLEHIEPEYLDNVLGELSKLAKKAIYLVISTRLANKILEDGRNAHLIVKPAKWWIEKTQEAFPGWVLERADTSKPGEVTLILLGV